MPIYEYSCNRCGSEFETLVRASTVPECPGCGSTDLGRKLSVFSTGAPKPEAGMAAGGPCGTCGNPLGPGACALD
jgi:putative FmdB family regulatory protein